MWVGWVAEARAAAQVDVRLGVETGDLGLGEGQEGTPVVEVTIHDTRPVPPHPRSSTYVLRPTAGAD